MLRFINRLLNKTLNADFGSFILAWENPGVNHSDKLSSVSEAEVVFLNNNVG